MTEPQTSRAIVHLPSLPRTETVAHEGTGRVEVVRPLTDADFETDLCFVDYVVVPPRSSIGSHVHGDDEELYYVLEGHGTMTIEEATRVVAAGDLVINRRGGRHGLTNDSDAPIRLLVWQVRYRGGE